VTPSTGTAPSTLTVTANAAGLAAGSYMGTITVSGMEGSSAANGTQVLTVGLAIDSPMIMHDGVMDAASYSKDGVTAGSIASLFGAGLSASPTMASLSPATPSAANGNSTTLALPTSLGKTQVLVNDVPAPLLYVSPTQINFLVPAGTAGNNVPVVVVNNGVRSLAATVNIQATAPRIFTIGGTQGAVLNGDYSVNGAAAPAGTGTAIQIFAVGLGATNPPATIGQIAGVDPLMQTTTLPVVTVGGVQAKVLFAGLAPGAAGLYQVNAVVPGGVAAGNSVPLQITMGQAASNTVTIAVH
jgi:uncharacterized protein (TIGR03437 family)